MSGVASDVDHRIVGQVSRQNDGLHGNQNNDQAQAEELNNCFGGLKSKNCPRRWAYRSVVTGMRVLEYRPPMHQPMRPVKQSIVSDQTDDKTDWNVIQRILERVPVDPGQAGFVHLKQSGSHD